MTISARTGRMSMPGDPIEDYRDGYQQGYETGYARVMIVNLSSPAFQPASSDVAPRPAKAVPHSGQGVI